MGAVLGVGGGEVGTEVPGRLGWFVMCLRSQGGMSQSGYSPSSEKFGANSVLNSCLSLAGQVGAQVGVLVGEYELGVAARVPMF